MKKRLSLIVALTLVLISLFTLGLSNKQVNAATLSDQEKVEQEVNNIVMPEKAIIDFPVVSTSAYGSTITWESNNSAVLNVPQNGGWVVVTRPTDADAVVELKVTITLNQATAYNTFEILVPKGVTETNTYRINYVLNGGVQNASNPASYKVGTTPVLAAPTKGTVEFLGWYDNAEFEGSAMTQLPKGLSGDYTVYAKWAPTVLDSIEVTKAPTKVVYNALESFDPTGIEVEAHYNDGTSKALSLEEIQSITYDLDVLHYGNNKVVATYEGKTAEIAITVNKLQYDLSNVVFEDATKTYNGQAQTLTAEGVPAGLTAVVDGSATHVAEGAVTITLSFVNSNPDYEDVTDEITATLTITPASATVTARSATFKVGTTPTFSYSVSGLIGNDQLSGTAVYECAANNTSPAGDYPVKVSGLSNSDYVVTFVDGVITMNDGQYMIVVDDADLVKVYNGQNQMFTPRLMDGNTEIEGIEFTYSYNDVEFTGATDVKVYSVVVSYDSATYGSGSQTFTFEITARSLEQAWFEELPAVSYNGSAHTPDVVGKYNDKPLVKDVDYTLSYEANTQVGTATVTVTGKGNFKDSCDLHFVIRVADLERVQATRVELEQTYAALNGKLDKVEDLMVESTANETSIFWMSTSTAMSVSKEGKVSVILTSEEQTVVLYALITAGDAAEYAMFTVTLPKQVSTSDEESNVSVEGVQDGAVVKVEQTDGSEVNYEVVGDEEVIAGYEITLQQNNQTVQPMDEVTVKLPVPAGYNQDTLKVYYVNGEEQTDMNAHVEGEYLVFTTTHFSKYIVVGEPEQGSSEEENNKVVFELGENDATKVGEEGNSHDGTGINSYSDTVSGYTLTLESLVKVYAPAYDALGDAGLKLGTSSLIGSFSFTVPTAVTSVILKVAGYKTKTAKISVNNSEQTIATLSADGEYTDVTVDTSSTKTVVFSTLDGACRCKITSITFIIGSTGGENVTPDPTPTHTHNQCYVCKKCYSEDCDGDASAKCSCLDNLPTDGTLTIAQAIVIGSRKEHNTYTSEKYTVTGTVNDIYNPNYGNMHLLDENGNDLTIYGLYIEGTRYGEYTGTKPQQGEIITVNGIIGQYNGTPQIKNADLIVESTGGEEEQHTCTPCGVEGCNKCIDPECPNEKCPGHSETPAVGKVTVSVSIADYATANGWVNSTQYKTLTMDNNVSVSVTGGTNTGKYYTSGTNWRMYQTENPSIVVSAAEGYNIVSIKISYTIDKTGVLTQNGTQIESDTVVEVNANSMTFSVGNTGTATNGQVRITAIEVVYEANNN